MSIKSKEKYQSTVDKELNYFKTNITRITDLKPTKYSADRLIDTNFNRIDNSSNQLSNYDDNSNIDPNKKPVVVIKSFPKDEPLPPKKPVLIIKRNTSKINKEFNKTPTKKPVVSIISQSQLEQNRNDYNHRQNEYKNKPLNIDFDAAPTQEQINRSSVILKPRPNHLNNNNNEQVILFSNNKSEPINPIEKEKEHKRDFFHTKPVSSVFIKNLNDDDKENEIDNDYLIQEEKPIIFSKENKPKDEFDNKPIDQHINEIDHIDEQPEPVFKYDNKENESALINIDKGTSFTKKIYDYQFEWFALDSIEKSIATAIFKNKIFRKLNMRVNYHDLVVVYSPNSGGKTTLLNIISKKESFSSGEYLINDMKYKQLTNTQMDEFITNHVFYLHRAIGLNYKESIYTHLKNAFIDKSQKYKFNFDLDSIIEKFNLAGYVNKTFDLLDNVQKIIVLIVFAIVSGNQIILIDDPILPDNKQDDYIIKNALRLANSFYGKTIIITSSNKRLFDIATKTYVLNRGVLKLI